MASRVDEDNDVVLIKELIFDRRELKLERFSRAETLNGKTPDFRVLQSGKLVAFCELKSTYDDWLKKQLDAAAPLELVGGLRNDPTFNRIARHVIKAEQQFDAVNATRTLPNILVFANHDRKSAFSDLRETLTGLFHSASGERFPLMMHISEGRLKSIKRRIDLYAWIDVRTRRVQGFFFSETSPEHVNLLCKLLGLDASRIKH